MPALGLVSGTTGNLGTRIGDELILTPTRTPYETLRRRDLVSLDLDGVPRGRGGRPSREAPMHAAVLRDHGEGTVIHTHSTYALAWSFLGIELEPSIEENAYYDIGAVGTLPPLPSGSTELAEAVAGALGGSNAVLLAGHGVVAVGATPTAALHRALAVENQAEVCWLLRLAGEGSDNRHVRGDADDAG